MTQKITLRDFQGGLRGEGGDLAPGRIFHLEPVVEGFLLLLRLRGETGFVDPAGMGIGSGDRDADMRFEKRADRAPGAGVIRLPQPAFDVSQQMIGQNGDEQMGPCPVSRVVEDGTQAQIGL